MKSKQTLQFDEKLIFTEIDEFEYFSREKSLLFSEFKRNIAFFAGFSGFVLEKLSEGKKFIKLIGVSLKTGKPDRESKTGYSSDFWIVLQCSVFLP